jgi:hypothetical protein
MVSNDQSWAYVCGILISNTDLQFHDRYLVQSVFVYYCATETRKEVSCIKVVDFEV